MNIPAAAHTVYSSGDGSTFVPAPSWPRVTPINELGGAEQGWPLAIVTAECRVSHRITYSAQYRTVCHNTRRDTDIIIDS